MVFDKTGEMILKAKDFEEDLIIWNIKNRIDVTVSSELKLEDELISALCLGISDYCRKLGFNKVVIGLSGGIDSSVVASLATLALGKENVLGVAMPGPYNSSESLEDAKILAKNLGIKFRVIPIDNFFEESKNTLKEVFKNREEDVTEENIQSRLRGVILMAISNKFGYLVLNTGNKSELAVGYCTLYGDTNGALSILGDVKKTLVYKIARRINERYSYIPERVLLKPPSAELRPGQKDEDSLPPYEFLDKVIEKYIEEGKGSDEIIEEIGEEELVKKTLNMIKNNEYKRRQTPPVLKVTRRAFGIGWRFPIAHGYKP
jgi:NAD+ synthetase